MRSRRPARRVGDARNAGSAFSSMTANNSRVASKPTSPLLRRPLTDARKARSHVKGSRALYIYIGNDRTATGRHCYGPQGDGLESVVFRLTNAGPKTACIIVCPCITPSGGRRGLVGVAGGRLRRVARALFRFQLLGRRGRDAMHDVSIYRRTLPLSAQRAGLRRRRGGTVCGSSSATDCAPMCGRGSDAVSTSRAFSNSTPPRPKAISRFITSRASRWRYRSRPRLSRASFPDRARRYRRSDAGAGVGTDGFCHTARRWGETGEAVARIETREGSSASFDGYVSPEDSDRKVLRDVFEPGDAWMRSGDLMRKDPHGFYFFADRIGDSFRWRGENVSTFEVAQTLAGCPGVRDVNVPGVAVPGHEGRAGMAALVTTEDFDLDRLLRSGMSSPCLPTPAPCSCV